MQSSAGPGKNISSSYMHRFEKVKAEYNVSEKSSTISSRSCDEEDVDPLVKERAVRAKSAARRRQLALKAASVEEFERKRAEEALQARKEQIRRAHEAVHKIHQQTLAKRVDSASSKPPLPPAPLSYSQIAPQSQVEPEDTRRKESLASRGRWAGMLPRSMVGASAAEGYAQPGALSYPPHSNNATTALPAMTFDPYAFMDSGTGADDGEDDDEYATGKHPAFTVSPTGPVRGRVMDMPTGGIVAGTAIEKPVPRHVAEMIRKIANSRNGAVTDAVPALRKTSLYRPASSEAEIASVTNAVTKPSASSSPTNRSGVPKREESTSVYAGAAAVSSVTVRVNRVGASPLDDGEMERILDSTHRSTGKATQVTSQSMIVKESHDSVVPARMAEPRSVPLTASGPAEPAPQRSARSIYESESKWSASSTSRRPAPAAVDHSAAWGKGLYEVENADKRAAQQRRREYEERVRALSKSRASARASRARSTSRGGSTAYVDGSSVAKDVMDNAAPLAQEARKVEMLLDTKPPMPKGPAVYISVRETQPQEGQPLREPKPRDTSVPRQRQQEGHRMSATQANGRHKQTFPAASTLTEEHLLLSLDKIDTALYAARAAKARASTEPIHNVAGSYSRAVKAPAPTPPLVPSQSPTRAGPPPRSMMALPEIKRPDERVYLARSEHVGEKGNNTAISTVVGSSGVPMVRIGQPLPSSSMLAHVIARTKALAAAPMQRRISESEAGELSHRSPEEQPQQDAPKQYARTDDESFSIESDSVASTKTSDGDASSLEDTRQMIASLRRAKARKFGTTVVTVPARTTQANNNSRTGYSVSVLRELANQATATAAPT